MKTMKQIKHKTWFAIAVAFAAFGVVAAALFAMDALSGLSLAGESDGSHYGLSTKEWFSLDWQLSSSIAAENGNDLSNFCPPGYQFAGTVNAKVTAYEPSYLSCGKSADGLTSIGHDAWYMDGCAVDPRAIPYGYVIYIPGIGLREADDTGPAMKRNWRKGVIQIDARFPDVYSAKQWGVQRLDVKVFKKL